MGHIYRLKTSYKNGKSRLILKSMNVKKYCFSTLLLIFLGITCSYAEPPVIKVGAGNGQGNALNFTQFEPFVAEYSGFKTSGTNNDLWVGLIKDNNSYGLKITKAMLIQNTLSSTDSKDQFLQDHINWHGKIT